MRLLATIAAAALLAGGLVVVAGASPSAGTYEHARALGVRCSTCHDSNRPHLANLNAAGRHFLQHRSLDGYKPGAGEPDLAAAGNADPSTRPGLAVYTRACVVCHGPAGRGTALAAPLAGPRTRASTEAAAVDVIRNGIDGTPMAPFAGALTDQEIRDVAKYVMTLKPVPPRR